MTMSINWFSVGATSLVLLLTCGLLGAMFLIIKLSSDDSGKYKVIKDMVETLFETPAHLRSSPAAKSEADNKEAAAQSAAALEPFVEACPACGDTVTESHKECPSCGLRLQ
ncbi:hypothetical protein DFQ01_14029 [Paenibacillus cellulosilyticus]|uniref:Uncharacterized protein n=1 Tax=Paenibacillus cellulosilyticus TaxID=375489 RepID=A0A2V2YEB5_9BACL|nr:hypothetical protein [Paenibacillus cellulosilyticus]PWV90646.1 hypothetical protein DFQ01_14029 [Paenibacillus cellulosilyticus]QKS43933.1 hypothetical protein HUB94_05440 [Paenibacillus cellulosilyticus]